MARRPRFRHRDVDAVAGVLALALAGTAFWLGVWPVLHAEEEARRLSDQMRSSQSQLDAAQARYRDLRAQITGTRERLEELAIELDAPGQLAARQADLGRVFGERQLRVDQLTVGTVEHGPLLDVIPMQISGTGSFPDLVRTMHALREVYPDMAVTAFQIGRAGAAGGEGVSFSLGVAWYVAREGAERG